MAGYSGTPLVNKLGIKPGHRLAIVRAPDGFDEVLGELPADVSLGTRLNAVSDILVFFTTRLAQLQRRFPRLMQNLDPNGGLWIAWPKRASGVATDVTEDRIRELALVNGLVDNKVCAIDDVWSGLRLVVRLKDRPKK